MFKNRKRGIPIAICTYMYIVPTLLENLKLEAKMESQQSNAVCKIITESNRLFDFYSAVD